MATIEFKNENWRAHIRKKEMDISQTFKNKKDAELWVIYKEDLIDQIEAFDPPLQQMITLQDAIELKIKDSIDKNIKDIGDFNILFKVFEKFCPKKLNQITYEDLLAHFDEMMNTPIRHGGNRNDANTGHMKLPSIHTTFRKFGYLSTVFQMMRELGVNIDNPVLKVCQFIRPKLKKKGNTNEQ